MVTYTLPANMEIDLIYILSIGVGLIAWALVTAWLWTFRDNMMTKAPEAVYFMRARNRKFGKTVSGIIDIVTPFGQHHFLNAEKIEPNDLEFKDRKYGIKIDPAVSSSVIPSDTLADGTRFYVYFTRFYLPGGTLGSRAIVALINYIRKEYSQLNYIRDDFTLIDLITTPADDLSEYAYSIIKKFTPDDIEFSQSENKKEKIFAKKTQEKIDNLAKTINEIKSKMKDIPIKDGYFSVADGFRNLPIGTAAADVDRAITYAQQKESASGAIYDTKKMADLKFIAGILGVVIVAYMIINAMN